MPPRAQAAHQQASHLVKQIRRRLAGEPLQDFRYRDFGSLVSLGEYSTVGSLMGFAGRRQPVHRGLFARLMYRSLYKMHEVALARRAEGDARHDRAHHHAAPEPRVKLH